MKPSEADSSSAVTDIPIRFQAGGSLTGRPENNKINWGAAL